MQKIFLSMATAGMTLARDLVSPEGRILCGKGTVLTDALLDRLRRMEASSLIVEGHPVEIAGEKTMGEEIAAIEARFSKVADSQPLMSLKQKLIGKLIATGDQK